ncbi:MAG: hypothetical protein OXI16_13735 [Chloroflexota bacterium]|nr:hypothetical protein [Chloroflexota bacterium]
MTTDTERQEEQTYETVPERLAAIETQQRLMLGEMRENARRADDNARRADDNYKVLVNKMESNQRWTIGLMVTLNAVTVSTIIGAAALFLR